MSIEKNIPTDQPFGSHFTWSHYLGPQIHLIHKPQLRMPSGTSKHKAMQAQAIPCRASDSQSLKLKLWVVF